MSEMVDRVARAIFASQGNSEALDKASQTVRISVLMAARAAIAAMREPTDAMVNAADPGTRGEDWPAHMAWPAMIDEALK